MTDVMKAPPYNWQETRHRAVFPLDAQPKLNGLRCLAYWSEGRVVLQSRGNKEWNLEHIREAVARILPPDSTLDGEIYAHRVPFQTIQSWAGREQPDTRKLRFHVFDVPVWRGETAPWKTRRAWLAEVLTGGPIARVVTVTVASEADLLDFQTRCVAEGYEGAMARSLDGAYECGKRSYGLLKVKMFEDAEFEVTGFAHGSGKAESAVTWVCRAENGREFRCDPVASYDERADMLQCAERYIGKRLTVKFLGRSLAGIPQFPKGLHFRDARDLERQTENEKIHL